MLYGIDELLTPDALHVLAAMGHGDTLVLCDANFPAAAVARHTAHATVYLGAQTTTRAARAILSLMPLDSFVAAPIRRMAVVDAPDSVPEVQQELIQVARALQPDCPDMLAVERMAFYEEARRAFAVFATLERRFYGCFLLTKGVIAPPAEIRG